MYLYVTTCTHSDPCTHLANIPYPHSTHSIHLSLLDATEQHSPTKYRLLSVDGPEQLFCARSVVGGGGCLLVRCGSRQGGRRWWTLQGRQNHCELVEYVCILSSLLHLHVCGAICLIWWLHFVKCIFFVDPCRLICSHVRICVIFSWRISRHTSVICRNNVLWPVTISYSVI